MNDEKQEKLSKDTKQFSGKGKKRKPYRKDRKCDSKESPKEEPTKVEFKPGNDFGWWNKIPELISDCTNFKSNYVAGRPISSFVNYIVPGVLEVKLTTSYHPCIGATDPINVWARDLYLKMFQKYRPASGYSASDLGISLVAGFEAIKLFAMYERIYGVINRYSVRNVNMPLVEAEALGLTATQVTYLQGHMSDFRYDLNYLARKAQRLCIPKDISFLAQAISLFGYEFIDHESPRGQIIVFTLDHYGVYSDTALTSGGSVQFSGDIATDLFDFTADNMCKALDNVLDALLNSDSIQRIYADLVVWFGSDAMLQILPIPEDYMIVPVYSEEILHEVHNLETLYDPTLIQTSFIDNQLSTTDQGSVGNGNYWVYQVNDRIVTVGDFIVNATATPQPWTINGFNGKILTTTSSATCLDNAHIIDGYKEEPDPEFVLEGTMFKASILAAVPALSNYGYVVQSSVSYIARYVMLHDNTTNIPSNIQTLHTTLSNCKQAAGELALVDWAPMTYYISAYDVITAVYGDLDVMIPITRTELERIHRTAFLSGLHTDASPLKG